jgi:DNA polymerase III subunit epsilon
VACGNTIWSVSAARLPRPANHDKIRQPQVRPPCTTSSMTNPEELILSLEVTGDYRVLRRFQPVASYHEPDGAPLNTAVALDVETTGLSPARDAIIQLALVPFEYAPESGRIYTVGAPLTFLEDPGRPIPAEIVALTGITDADVRGKRIDEGMVEKLVRSASLVIAHNAAFDRPFSERRLPLFREKPWACSQSEVPWRSAGSRSSALEFLLIKRCGMFYGAHRADYDCLALIHLLATPLESGQVPLSLLLQSARRKSVRIWAEKAPIESKDALRARRYRWSPGSEARPRAWFRELPAGQREEEMEWLYQNVYGGRRPSLRTDLLDATIRYSDRV